jgi:proteasome lid subunit RPN8/RPN11
MSDHWRVGAEVFGTISRWAKPRGLSLLGIVHTHLPGVPARLSWADRHQSVRVPGILAVVIGNGGQDADHLDWGWYVCARDDYRRLHRTELVRRVRLNEQGADVWRADGEGLCRPNKN